MSTPEHAPATPSTPAARLPTRWWALIALVIVLDQLSKYAVAQRLVPYEAIRLTPFFQLVHVYNTGAAFSMLAEHPAFARIFFIALACGVSLWLLHMLRQHAHERLLPAGLSLIIGGAIGNVIDRISRSAVLDFLYFHYQNHGFPAFNLADSAITLGVILMFWSQFFTPPPASS